MHTIKDALGDRMKGYENISRNYLTKRIPVIIRIDGKAFHTFTKGFKKPFDDILMESMKATMKYLCENIQGCVLGYTQSDEITLVLTDYETTDTQGWFEYNIQKMVSVSASLATFAFNRVFSTSINDVVYQPDELDYYNRLSHAANDGALFDSRVFTIPREEVTNCLIWRQQDATRNSILSVAQSLYSHKELQGISCNKLQDKMLTEKNVNWNNLSTDKKRGSCCIKKQIETDMGDKVIIRNRWEIDNNIPIFTEDREYIEKLL